MKVLCGVLIMASLIGAILRYWGFIEVDWWKIGVPAIIGITPTLVALMCAGVAGIGLLFLKFTGNKK